MTQVSDGGTVAPQPSAHAILSPSSSSRWLLCAGAPALEIKVGAEDSAGDAAKRGTFMHHVSALCLTLHKNAVDYMGYQENVEGLDCTLDSEMAELVQTYVDTVRNYRGFDGQLWVEVELDISHLTGEPGAIGTADAVVIRGDELCVIDLKTGRTDVEAADNSQLAIYSLAALEAYQKGLLGAPVTFPVASDNDADDLC